MIVIRVVSSNVIYECYSWNWGEFNQILYPNCGEFATNSEDFQPKCGEFYQKMVNFI